MDEVDEADVLEEGRQRQRQQEIQKDQGGADSQMKLLRLQMTQLYCLKAERD